MIIKLEATGRFETFRGVQYRVYKGITDGGVRLEMLGMFRIPDMAQRDSFNREISAIPVESTGQLLTDEWLIKP